MYDASNRVVYERVIGFVSLLCLVVWLLNTDLDMSDTDLDMSGEFFDWVHGNDFVNNMEKPQNQILVQSDLCHSPE
ncbi:MAG: hypothetical protein ACD_46C00265G0005 [uncultured bacterium]|nr:MAG: hypothetical protein ACD_46C00265G0005 [uncultured bacterium]